jgi:hypothetical protein
MKTINLTLFIVVLAGNSLKAQISNCQSGIGQLPGVIAFQGKKVKQNNWPNQNGTTNFSIVCDRTIEGICFYYTEDGRSDTVLQKVCEGVMNPKVPNVTLYNEFHQPIFTGTLLSYWDFPETGSPLWVRNYTFQFE